MPEIRIGVITDSHMGRFDAEIAEALKGEGLDAAAFLGDAPRSINGHTMEQFGHLIETLQTYDRIGVPTFWIPGNYEDFKAYHSAFRRFRTSSDNIIDATRLGRYPLRRNGMDVDLVFVPGTRDFSRGFMVTDETETGDYETRNGLVHVFNPNDLEKLVTRPEETIILAHSPIKMEGNETFDISTRALYLGKEIVGPAALDLIREGLAAPVRKHVGNESLGRLVNKTGVRKYVSGDIHEAACTTDRNGTPIPNGTFSVDLFGNPGPAVNGKYGVLVYRSDKTAALQRKSVA